MTRSPFTCAECGASTFARGGVCNDCTYLDRLSKRMQTVAVSATRRREIEEYRRMVAEREERLAEHVRRNWATDEAVLTLAREAPTTEALKLLWRTAGYRDRWLEVAREHDRQRRAAASI